MNTGCRNHPPFFNSGNSLPLFSKGGQNLERATGYEGYAKSICIRPRDGTDYHGYGVRASRVFLYTYFETGLKNLRPETGIPRDSKRTGNIATGSGSFVEKVGVNSFKNAGEGGPDFWTSEECKLGNHRFFTAKISAGFERVQYEAIC